jgi:hypothetical protein
MHVQQNVILELLAIDSNDNAVAVSVADRFDQITYIFVKSINVTLSGFWNVKIFDSMAQNIYTCI